LYATNKALADDDEVFFMEHIDGTNQTVDGFYDATTSQLAAHSLSNNMYWLREREKD
jgi:hypothetical protein